MRFSSPIYPSVIAIISKLASVCSTRHGRREIRTRHRLRYRQLYTLAGVIRAAKAMHIFICAFCQGT